MKEFAKTLGFLVVAGLLVAGAWFTRSTAPTSPAVFSLQGQAFFPDFKDWGSAVSLEVYDFDESKNEPQAFKVEFKEGVWRIPSKDNYPADAADRLSSVAGVFATLERGQLRSNVGEGGAEKSWVETQKDCGVIDPRAPLKQPTEGRGRRIVLRDSGDEVLADLIVGAELEETYGTRFVRRADEKQIYTAKLDLEVSTAFGDWIESDLLQLNAAAITSITVRRYTVDEEQIRLGRIYLDEEDTIVLGQTGVAQWTVDGMTDQQQASMAAVDSMTETLSELTIKDVLPFSVDELFRIGIFPTNDGVFSNEGELRVDLNTGVRYNLRFGEVVHGEQDDEGLRRYLWIDAEPFYEALPNPEDPEARKGAETAVEALNKRFGGWFYVIGAKSFDALRPTRKGLLEARTEPIEAEPGTDFFPPVEHGPDDGHGHEDPPGETPPEDGGETPPEDGGETPPEDGGETPPEDGGETPPEDGGETPPEDGGETPPEDGGETPPGEAPTPPPVEDPPAEDPPAEDPPAEDPPAEDPPAETPPAETPPAEDPPAETPPAETPPAEDPPAETPPAEDPPAETPPAETPPAETPRVEDPPAETPPAEDPPAPPPEETPPPTPESGQAPPAESPPLAGDPPIGATGHTFHRDAAHWTKQAEGADTALNLAPDYAGALFLQGEANLRLGKHEAARASLEQVVGKDAKHARAFALLGEVYLGLDNLEAALEHAQHAVELAPKSTEAQRVMAQIGLNQQDAGPARDHATHGLELDPLDVDLLFLRGDAHAALGQPALAKADWSRGVQLLPQHPRAEAIRTKLDGGD